MSERARAYDCDSLPHVLLRVDLHESEPSVVPPDLALLVLGQRDEDLLDVDSMTTVPRADHLLSVEVGHFGELRKREGTEGGREGKGSA